MGYITQCGEIDGLWVRPLWISVSPSYILYIFNPRRACAARVTVLVCLSVYAYSRSAGYEAAYERYQQLEGYESMKIIKAIFLKRLRSRDMA